MFVDLLFYSIYGIREKHVYTVLNKQNSIGVIEPDKHGHAVPSTKVIDERKQSVLDHIASMPKVSSHYSKAKSPHRKYLPPGLNINTMYTLYLDWLKDNNSVVEPVNSHFYRNIFNIEFNVGFKPPCSDTCNLLWFSE